MSPVRRVVLLCTFLALVSVPALFSAGEKGGIGNKSSAACDFPTATFVDPTAVALGWPTQSQGNVTPGTKVKPGRWVQSNSELKCRDRVPRKQKCPAEPITDGDRDFMHAVVDVNVEFARAYSELSSSAITGINVNPCTHFNPNSVL